MSLNPLAKKKKKAFIIIIKHTLYIYGHINNRYSSDMLSTCAQTYLSKVSNFQSVPSDGFGLVVPNDWYKVKNRGGWILKSIELLMIEISPGPRPS